MDKRRFSRARRIGKWTAVVTAGLFVLAALILLGASLIRQPVIEQHQAALRTNIDRVKAEVCGGSDPEEWFRARVRGTNGWQHLRFLDRAMDDPTIDSATHGPEDRSRVFWTLKALNEWHQGEWKPRSWDNESEKHLADPGTARIQQWLHETDVVADAFAKAAKCDVVAPDARFGGVRVFDWLEAAGGMFGRHEALRQRGLNTRAELELLHCAQVWCKFDYPTTIVEHALALGLAGRVFVETEELLIREKISVEAASAIAQIEFNCEKWLRAAFEGEAAWFARNATKVPWLVEDPSLLGWLTRPDNPGEGMFAEPDFVNSFKARYTTPMNLTREVAAAIEAVLHAIENLDGDSVREPRNLQIENTSMLAVSPEAPYEAAIGTVRLRHKQLSLAFRLLQIRHGELLGQKQVVEQTAGNFRDVTLEWDEQHLVLGVLPRLLAWAETAEGAGLDPTDPAVARVLAMLKEDQDYNTYVEPLADARERLAHELKDK